MPEQGDSGEVAMMILGVPERGEAFMGDLAFKQLLGAFRLPQNGSLRLVWVQGRRVESSSKGTDRSGPVIKMIIRRGIKRAVAIVRENSDAN